MAVYIVGVDPSAAKTNNTDAAIGWAVLKDGELLEHGDLTPDPPYFTRTRNWVRNKVKRLKTVDTDQLIFVVESVYMGHNPNIFMGLIQCQSHVCAAALDSGASFRFVSPMDSFKAATGLKQYPLNEKGTRSGTRKKSIQSSLRAKYGLSEDVSEHEFDALALCLAVIQGK